MTTSRKSILAILLLGLAIRLGLCISNPRDLTTDHDGYLAHARMVANGEGFSGPFTSRPTAFRPPAYPVCLGLLIRCGVSDSLCVAIINIASSLVILWLTMKLALQSGLSLAGTFAAMLGVALDPLLIRYTSLPMTEVPCAAILLAAVVWYRSSRNSLMPLPEPSAPAPARPVSTWTMIVSGILFGAGGLVRPVLLISCAFLTVGAVVSSWRERRRQRCADNAATPATHSFLLSTFRFSVVLPAIVAAFTITPWIIRNAIVFGHFIPATTHGGYTLALGNNQAFYRDVIRGPDRFPWDGESLNAWQQQMNAASRADGVSAADEPAQDAWYYDHAFAAVRAEPWSFLKASVLRLKRFWAISAADTQSSRIMTLAVSTWYGLLWIGLAFQFIGCWFHRKSKQFRGSGELWLVVFSFLLMHAVYWTDTRMRAPVMPILCVLSVAGWSVAADIAESSRTRHKAART